MQTFGRRQHFPDALRRSAKACNRCRKRRTKCMGDPPYPCVSCSETGHACVYAESEKRVTVTESYLLQLQAQARASTAGRESSNLSVDLDEATSQDIELGFTGTDNWIVSSSGQYHFMGNSSSTYIANRLNPTAETLAWHKYPHHHDTTWLGRTNSPEIPSLPPRDIAQRLYRAQHAYIGTIFAFLTDSAFHERLQRVYSREPDPSDREERLIYCQILLVLAFGQMYSINQWIGKEGPPGFEYFKHALDFLPNMYEEASLLFIEVLSYVAYFMQTINRRDAAYVIIGIAMRMAISLGLHQEVSDQDIDSDAREHRRRVWWSTYSMERLLCVSSGHPLSIQDEDIDVLLPSQKTEEDSYAASILTCYTELSRIQGIIGENIYRKRQKSGSDLSACVQDIMQRLSSWFEQLPEAMKSNPPDSDQPPRREVVSTYLHYYHCINMTARPILLYAVQRQLASGPQSPSVAGWENGLSRNIVNVIDRAISAARSSVSILNVAARYNLVGELPSRSAHGVHGVYASDGNRIDRAAATYGFIDGEQAFSAALLLVMVNMAFPYNEVNASAMIMALDVLQTMAERGNEYIRACHSLLTKIKKPQEQVKIGDPGPSQALTRVPMENEALPQASTMIAGLPHDQAQPISWDFEGDPALWAEVLESIDIDMDRQWVETAVRRGQQQKASGSTS